MTLEELQNTIRSEVGVLLYFSGENCNVCHALRPKFKDLFDNEFSHRSNRSIWMLMRTQKSPLISKYSQYRP